MLLSPIYRLYMAYSVLSLFLGEIVLQNHPIGTRQKEALSGSIGTRQKEALSGFPFAWHCQNARNAAATTVGC